MDLKLHSKNFAIHWKEEGFLTQLHLELKLQAKYFFNEDTVHLQNRVVLEPYLLHF